MNFEHIIFDLNTPLIHNMYEADWDIAVIERFLKMKVCFINILYSMKDERGGLGVHIADISSELSKRGHQVTVITSGQGRPYNEGGVKIIPLGKVDKYSRPSQILNPRFLLSKLCYMLRMTRYILRSDFDVVECAEGGAEHLFLILFSKRPVIITKLHGNFRNIYSPSRLLTSVAEKLEGSAVRKSDGIYTSSLAYSQSISNEYKVPLERIRVIPYGIDISCISERGRIDLRREYPVIRDKKVIFLSVGSSPERKGAQVFIEAAAKSRQDNIHFVLSCSDKRFLSQTEMPSNVLVLPNLNRGRYYDWISHSDIVVLPSQFESFSIALREAMLFGRTIIVSSHVPLEDIDREYPKYCVLEKIDSNLLAELIFQITNDKIKFPEIDADYQQQLRNKYDLRRVAETTEAFYLEIISNKND